MSGLKAFPIVISGPSGAGKTTLVEKLIPLDPRLRSSISVTTRTPREGEIEGVDYHFVSREKFESMKKSELIEYAEVHGFLYGTPRGYIEEQLSKGHDVVLNIDVQGGLKVRKAFPEAAMIFILPPSFETLRERMLMRGSGQEPDINLRLENARKEIAAIENYEYLVVNDTVEKAVEEILAIISAERNKNKRYLESFLQDFFG